MKKLLLITVLLSVQFTFGQKLYKKDLLQIEKDIYTSALKNYDLDAAKNAVYQILNLEGEKSSYQDSLAIIYFNQKNYLSCLSVSDKILKSEEKLNLLEIKAVCLENLNAPKEAIETYEKIYKQKKDPLVAYKLGNLQYRIKRMAEAFATLKSGESLKFPEKGYIGFQGAKKNEMQNVPFKAAYYNLMAMVSYELHNYDMAIKYFDEALKVYPDFFVAKQNRQAVNLMKEKLQQTNKPGETKTGK